MKITIRWILDILASMVLFTVFYTLRLVKAPLWWITLDEYSFWSLHDRIISIDIMLFIGIVVFTCIWVFTGITWVFIGLSSIVSLILLASAYIWIKNKIKKMRSR